LKQRGCSDSIARAIARTLPRRSPLILHLAAEALLRSSPYDREQIVRDLEQGNVAPELVSGYLYKRVFTHIDDPALRRYVSASLALPELHPDLLEHVLVPILEPEREGDSGYSARLFEDLTAIRWLMQKLEGDRVRLRPDLRTLIVDLMRSDPESRHLHTRVRNRAIRFHRSKPHSPWDQAMGLYHTIIQAQQCGASKADLAQFCDEVTQAAQYLTPYVADLPLSLRLMLSQHDGNEVNLEEASQYLSDEQWQRLMDGADGHNGHGRELVTRHDPLVAHELYRARPTTRDGLPPAYALHAACDTGRWEELDVNFAVACNKLYDQISSARRWGPHLLHLAALLRFSLFAIPERYIRSLQSLTHHLLGRCSAYGASVSIADMVAIAEVFHGEDHLTPQFIDRLRPGDQTNRIAFLRLLRNRHWPGIGFTASAVFSFNRQPAVDAKWLGPYEFMNVGDVHELHGRRWSAFQRRYREVQKLILPSLVGEFPHLKMRLPELYRPLRQAMSETFAEHDVRRFALAHEMQQLFSVVPHELQSDRFEHYAAVDPHTWFYALCEHADRSEALPQLVELCSTIAPGSATRWAKVADLYRLWNARLSTTPLFMNSH
jgi:hypothetical protein